jgi:hypothetical protein
MAEEADPKGTDQPTLPGTEDKSQAIEAARKTLLDEGFQILDSSAFHGIKAKAAKTAEAERDKAVAEFETLRAEHEAAQARLAKIDNEGKSEAELFAQRQQAWQAQDEAKNERITELETQIKQQAEARANAARDQKLGSLLVGATNPDLALLWARQNLKGLTINEDGDLIYTESTGVPHVGLAAEKIVQDWWAKQADLRTSPPPGPAITGSAESPPAPQAEVFNPDPSLPLSERLTAAAEFDMRQAAKGRKT